MSEFIDDKPSEPYVFIQWKGTDVCLDFNCDCGAYAHVDAFFCYALKCHHCGQIWEMPSYLKPRKVASYEGVVVTQPHEAFS